MAINEAQRTPFEDILECRKLIPMYQRDFVWGSWKIFWKHYMAHLTMMNQNHISLVQWFFIEKRIGKMIFITSLMGNKG